MKQTRMKSHDDPKPGDHPWLSSETTLDLWEPMEMVRQQVLWRIVNISTEYQTIPNLKVHSDFQLANSMCWSSIFLVNKTYKTQDPGSEEPFVRIGRNVASFFDVKKWRIAIQQIEKSWMYHLGSWPSLATLTSCSLAMQRGYVIYLYIMVEECLMVKSDSTWKYCNIHGMWYIQ